MSATHAVLGPALAVGAKATVLLLLAAGAAYALRRRASASTRHLLWTLALSGLLALPLLSQAVPPLALPLGTFAASLVPSPRAPQRPATLAEPAATPTSSVSGIAATPGRFWTPADATLASDTTTRTAANGAAAKPSFARLAIAAYLIGVLLLLLRLALAQWAAAQLVALATPASSPEWREVLATASRRLGLRRDVRLLHSALAPVPFALGDRRPVVILPVEADAWDPARREAVLAHELAHVARRDCLTQTLASLACALYWPHPGVWWAAARLRLERELACDDHALAAGHAPTDYARHLLELARAFRPHAAVAPLAVGMAAPSQLERRLRAVVDGARRRGAPSRRAMLAVACAAAGVLLPLSALQPVAAQAAALSDAAIPSDHASADASARTTGRWDLRRADAAEGDPRTMVHVSLWTPGLNTFYAPSTDFDSLAGADIDRAGAAHFRLRRDAGTLVFDGRFAQGRGTGDFHYLADPAFIAALRARGMRAPTPAEQFSFACHGAALAFLDTLDRLGYARPSTESFLRATLSSADAAYAQGLAAQGMRIGTLDALVTLANHGVDAALVADARDRAGHAPSVQALVRMANHPDEARALASADADATVDIGDIADDDANENANTNDDSGSGSGSGNDDTLDNDDAEDAADAADAKDAKDVEDPKDARRADDATEADDERDDAKDTDDADDTAAATRGPSAPTPVTGTWTIGTPRGGSAALELAWDDHTQWRRTLALSELTPAGAGRFKLAGEAGTITFDGALPARGGTGRFRFTPNRGFPARLRQLGIRGTDRVSDHQLKNLAWGGASVQSAREFQQLGLKDLSVGDLTDFAVFNLRPAFVRQMRARGARDTDTVQGITDLRLALQASADP